MTAAPVEPLSSVLSGVNLLNKQSDPDVPSPALPLNTGSFNTLGQFLATTAIFSFNGIGPETLTAMSNMVDVDQGGNHPGLTPAFTNNKDFMPPWLVEPLPGSSSQAIFPLYLPQ